MTLFLEIYIGLACLLYLVWLMQSSKYSNYGLGNDKILVDLLRELNLEGHTSSKLGLYGIAYRPFSKCIAVVNKQLTRRNFVNAALMFYSVGKLRQHKVLFAPVFWIVASLPTVVLAGGISAWGILGFGIYLNEPILRQWAPEIFSWLCVMQLVRIPFERQQCRLAREVIDETTIVKNEKESIKGILPIISLRILVEPFIGILLLGRYTVRYMLSDEV